MLVNANPPTDALPVDRFAQQIAAVCATHMVTTGSPDSLVGFMQALDENKLLAMNFWSVVARVSDESGSAAPNRVLETIIESVTGRSSEEVRAASAEQNVLVSRLVSMLAGEDVQRPVAWTLAEFDREASSGTPEDEAAVERASLGYAESRRLILNQQPDSATATEPAPTDTPEAPRISIPLAGHAARTDGMVSATVAGVGLLLALLAGGLSFGRNRNHAGWKHFAASIRNAAQAGPNARSKDRAQPAASTSAAAQPLVSNPNARTPAPVPGAVPANRISVGKNAPKQIAAAQNPPLIPAPRAKIGPPVPGTGDLPANDSASASATETTLVVAGESMRRNLIASRVPVVPAAAKAERRAGRVVLHAIITKQGNVEQLWVIEGDPELRRAAVDSVAKWHYLPYLLNGTPVDVSTTIAVDFPAAN